MQPNVWMSLDEEGANVCVFVEAAAMKITQASCSTIPPPEHAEQLKGPCVTLQC